MELFTDYWHIFNLRNIWANRVSVHVNLLQLAQFGETCWHAGESVVGEANVAELCQLVDSRGKSSQLVEAQLECVELLQEAEFPGKAGQTVVAQVQSLQVLETTNGDGDFLQLQYKLRF